MSIRKLKLLPGVNLEQSETLNQTNVARCGLIRFYSGLVEKRAGWQAINTATPFIGRCSGLHGWGDIVGNVYLAVGTEQRLAVSIGGMLQDITPLAATDNPTVAFTTSTVSNLVTITDSSRGPSIGDWIYLATQVSVGGIVLFGYYQVQTIPGANQFTVKVPVNPTANVSNGGAVPSFHTTSGQSLITVTLANHGFTTGSIFDAAVSTTVATLVIAGLYSVTFVDANSFTINAVSGTANATTTASMNSGNAQIQYLLPSGKPQATPESGYGAGLYGAGLYGGSSGQTIVQPRQWALDNFGQDLIASPTNGKIYFWQPPTAQPVTVINNSAPIYNTDVFVMSQAQIVFAVGCETGGTQEPLLARWCDAGDFTDWTASAINQAGSYFTSQGSRLVGGMAVGITALLWTDIGIESANYLGFPLVFGFQPIAVGCGLIGKRAKAVVGSLIMWLSQGSFFMLTLGGGAPRPMECPVWDVLTENADYTQPDLFVMGANSLTNEFELFFPIAITSQYYVAGSLIVGSVKYNYIENGWDYSFTAQLQRTAWEAQSPIGNPVGADLTGLLQQHEVGFNADSAPMSWFWQTGYFDIPEGEEFVFLDWIIPDFIMVGNSTISITVLCLSEPNATPTSVGPFTVTQATRSIPPFSIRGRQFAFLIQGSDLNSFNRLGAIRYRFAPDGRGS